MSGNLDKSGFQTITYCGLKFFFQILSENEECSSYESADGSQEGPDGQRQRQRQVYLAEDDSGNFVYVQVNSFHNSFI